jgi:glycine cleavage system H protein
MKMVALLVLLTILVFITVDYFVQRRRAAAVVAVGPVPFTVAMLDRAEYRTPLGVYFDPGHTWVYLEESGTARLGIDEFAQTIAGKIDRIDARPVGETVRKGDVILKIHHGGRAMAFRAPFDGVVKSVNKDMLDRDNLLGVEPYTAAWLYKIAPTDTSSFAQRMHLGSEAKQWLYHEVQRLKVFLATVAPMHPVLGTTMQDGGAPSADLIDQLDDAAWNKFKERFFGATD